MGEAHIEMRFLPLLLLALLAVYFFWPESNLQRGEGGVHEKVDPYDFKPGGQGGGAKPSLSLSRPLTRLEPKSGAAKVSQSPRAKYPNLDESFTPFDGAGNRYIEQIVQVGEHLIYHGDVLIGPANNLGQLVKKGSIKRGRARKWPNGRIPYVIDDSVVQEEKVLEAIDYLNTFTNLQITPREGEEDYVIITRGESHCYAYAGRIGGAQEIFLVPQCGVREILHEWMHTVGFFHEQNREDRDQYLKVQWDNIDKVNHAQFKKLPNDFIGVIGRPFDFQSIMLYSSFTFSVDRQEPAMLTIEGEIIPPSTQLLSEEDIRRVNLAYPK